MVRFSTRLWLAPALLVACSPDPEPAPESELIARRELAAAYYEEDRLAEAAAEIEWILTQPNAEAQDFVNAACVEIASVKDISKLDRAREYLARARELDPDSPALHYCEGVLDMWSGDLEAAQAHFAEVMRLAPDDIPARYHFASICADLDRPEEAERVLRGILDQGIERVGSFYLSAEYRLASLYTSSRDPEVRERGRALRASFQRHLDEGWPEPQSVLRDRGYLGRVKPPPRRAEHGRPPPEGALPYERVESGLIAEAGLVAAALVADVDMDQRPDILALSENGVFLAHQGEGARFDALALDAGRYVGLSAGDLSNWGRQSVLLIGPEGRVRLLVPDLDGTYHPRDLDVAGVRSAVFSDFDHDGDLDLVLAADRGLVLLRNDGLESEPAEGAPEVVSLRDASEGAGLPRAPLIWVVEEDYDADNDIDFLCGAEDGTWILCSNLRRGQFQALAPEDTGLRAGGAAPIARDVDADGLADVVVNDAVFRNLGGNRFAAEALTAVPRTFALADLDLDGQADRLFSEGGACRVRRGSPFRSDAVVSDLPAAPIGSGVCLAADVDGDGDLDLVGGGEGGGLDVWRSGLRPRAGSLRVRLKGRKDNRQGKGAVVEVRGGRHYERRLCRGEAIVFGFAGEAPPEVVRVTWPNGVIQHAILPRPDEPVDIVQKEGLVGSCPFLYTHDGTRWHFVSDILGITPLGLPIDGERFVPPDHDELVRITSEQLGPVDGEYRLQITEELREVTYLDRAQLWVVDHPAGVEIHPEERFCFPPFPPLEIHAVEDVRPIERAVDQDGRDWTEALREEDGEHAVPFEPLPSQFLGLVTGHYLEIALPPAVADAERIRLLMTGWLYWTDASVNVAAARDPRFEFVPPVLQVPDASGRFVDAGPPVGFPAGKTKTMVLDVTGVINRSDPRIRLRSTIRLYWDCVRVALDAGDAPFEVTRLEPTRAFLYERGFSAPMSPLRENQPERFDFERLRPPVWNQHQGMLTRYGDVRELLLEIDDLYCVFSAGDAIDLRFDAGLAPPGANRARTFLLFVDGWAKDGDPNTAHAGMVEPLPFHGMSGYPYPTGERYPQDEEHRRYLEQWNTRPGRRLIEPLLAPAEAGSR